MKQFNLFSWLDVRTTLALTVGSPSAHRRGTTLKHVAFLLLFLFSFGVGNAWGADELVYTLEPYNTGSDNTSTGYANAATALVDEIHWNVTGNTSQVPWRIGGNSISEVDRPLYSTDAISDNITKIEVVHGAASDITVNSMTVVVSKNSNFSNPVSTLTPTFEASNTVTINRPNGADWSNCYYKIIYNVTKSGTGNKFIAFTRAKFYAESAVARTVTLMDDTSHPLHEQSAGAGVTLPSREGCTGYTFAGWTASWEEEQDEWTSTAPTIIPAGTYHPAADVSLYPVYTKIVTGTPSNQTLSFAYSSHEGWELEAGRAFDKSNYYLLQKDCYIESPTISDLSSITSIVIGIGKFGGKGAGKVSDGTTDYETFPIASSTGNNSVTLQPESNPLSGSGKIRIVNTDGSNYTTVANSQAGIRFYSMTINYTTGGDVTYYISVPNCCTQLAQINGSVFVSHTILKCNLVIYNTSKVIFADRQSLKT